MIFQYWKRRNRWRIFIGRNPQQVPPRSIVLFPSAPATLHCGLAGILAIKGAADKEDPAHVSRLRACFQSMQAGDTHISSEVLTEMDKTLYAIKQNIDLQYRLHESKELEELHSLVHAMEALVQSEEANLEKKAGRLTIHELEIVSNRLIRIKDILWGLKEDLIKNQDKVFDLSSGQCTVSPGVFRTYHRLNLVLNALDRLEVRGRDSTGIQITLALPSNAKEAVIAALKEKGLLDTYLQRSTDGDLIDDSIRFFGKGVTFTYKTASVTGELGRNCRQLRKSIRNDAVFKALGEYADSDDMLLAHTRWASVGAITIPNCHPVDNYTLPNQAGTSGRDKEYPFYGRGAWFINAALNGDIDNYQTIKTTAEKAGWMIDRRVTTDTKTIPLQIEKYLLDGHDLLSAFRRALGDFEGSHAIAMESNLEPGKVFLALRGSGQALFVGLAENQYIFASEVYGLIEETPFFLKMDGERPRIEGDTQTMGQIFQLHNDRGPGLGGIDACYYDGYPLELSEKDIKKAEITTRDIDRGEFRHYLLKEILDAPASVRKTLRGKYRISARKVVFNLSEEVFPHAIIEALQGEKISNIFVIGQGTAAVAGSAIAEALSLYLKDTRLRIQAKKASDLSGFVSEMELAHSLIIAVTQSGTTTDTNRAVTLAREKGAGIIAIVNRRQSDITTKAHGVFYTSDGRDIEMSVASTKAFYSQIAAGQILALFLAQLLGALPDDVLAEELSRLEKAPALMNRVMGHMDEIRTAAWEIVRRKRYWAVVGSGANKVAADEVRIKLSELCYKTISSDIIEDKKHIDLSAEPLVLVMAAGSPEIVLEDIVKDTAIFKAHAARVVVVADEGEARFDTVADHVLKVPRSTFPLSIMLNTLVGHIWGYYAACSLDEQSALFKDFRAQLAEMVTAHQLQDFTLYESIESSDLKRIVQHFSSEIQTWRSSGCLTTMNVDTVSDLTLLFKYALGKLPMEDFQDDFQDRYISPSPLEVLDLTLGRAIDELARPIDAIRHQAKTVTVGTSRKAEVLQGILFDALIGCGFSMDNLAPKNVLFLKRLQTVVQGISGFTLYQVEGLDQEGRPAENSTISILKKGGIAEHMASRAERKGALMGTKRTIVRTGDIYAGGGKSDSASIVIIPLRSTSRAIEYLLLLHVEFDEELSVSRKMEILDEKYWDIQNLMNEENLAWNDDYLGRLSVKLLLGEAVEVLVERIKSRGNQV